MPSDTKRTVRSALVPPRLGGVVRARAGLVLLALFVAACAGGAPGGPVAVGAADPPVVVHGLWTIEVVNPDGTAGDTIEISNALSREGALELAYLLVGETSSTGLAVLAIADEADLSLECDRGQVAESGTCVPIADDCDETEIVSGNNCIDSELAANHTIATDGMSVTFTGQETRAEPWTVHGVQTYLRDPGQRLTIKELDEQVDVHADQTVNMTVVLSFG